MTGFTVANSTGLWSCDLTCACGHKFIGAVRCHLYHHNVAADINNSGVYTYYYRCPVCNGLTNGFHSPHYDGWAPMTASIEELE